MLGLEDGDLGAEVAVVVLEGVFAGEVRGVGNLGDEDGRKNSQDDHDDEDSDERESIAAVEASGARFAPHGRPTQLEAPAAVKMNSLLLRHRTASTPKHRWRAINVLRL